MSNQTNRVGLLLVTTLFLMSFSNVAYADHKKGGHGGTACKADIQQYCAQVEPGEGRIVACLKQHQSQLQALCQEKLPQMERVQQMKQTCQVDREKFCPKAERGKPARACMKKNYDLLSASCRTAIDEIKAWRKAHPPTLQQPATPPTGGSSASHWESLRSTLI
jgi:hypothetical protein